MGGNASKQTSKNAQKILSNPKLKEKAKYPNILKKDDPIDDGTARLSAAMDAKLTYLRQVDEEMLKQSKKPKPAPIQQKTSWGPEPLSRYYNEEQIGERVKGVEENFKDDSLAEKLKKVGSIDENFSIKYGFHHDNPYENKEKDQDIRNSYQLSVDSLDPRKNIQGRYGKVPASEIINIIHNHNKDPLEWDISALSKYTLMRPDEITKLVTHYDLIDNNQVNFSYPKDKGMHYNESTESWYIGKPPPDDADIKTKYRTMKENKKIIPTKILKQLRKDQEEFKPIDHKKLKNLNETYYINPDVYKELSIEKDPHDRILTTTKRSPARYKTNNLIDRLENEYRMELSDRERQELIDIDVKRLNLERQGILESREYDPISDSKEIQAIEHEIAKYKTDYQEVHELQQNIKKYENTKEKIRKIDYQKNKIKRDKHQSRFKDDAYDSDGRYY